MPSGDESLALTFSPMYSAYDGEHKFQVPVTVLDAPGRLKFRALDPSYVDVEPTGEASAMLTMKKAGKTTIIAELEGGDVWGRSELNITEATPAQWKLGEERYENGVEAFPTPDGGFMLPNFDGGFPFFQDGGFVLPEGGFPAFDAGAFMANPESACTFCHKPAGSTGGLGGGLLNIDVEHTPQQIGGYSDDELIAIFTMGKKPEGVPMRLATTPRLEETWKMTHQWEMEEEAKKGIIVYIRSLKPEAQGEVDFLGGLTRGDGGFMIPPGILDLLRDGGLRGIFGDGGLGGFFPRDAGAPPATTDDAEAPAADTGTGTEGDASSAADASQDLDAGAG